MSNRIAATENCNSNRTAYLIAAAQATEHLARTAKRLRIRGIVIALPLKLCLYDRHQAVILAAIAGHLEQIGSV